MQLFLTHGGQEWNVTERILCKFDGTTLCTYFDQNLLNSRPAKIGNSFFILSQGPKKTPKITEAELPLTRGARIAWALCFIGENKYAASYNDFWKQYQEISSKTTLHNTLYLINPSIYALCIADKVVESPKVKTPAKVKQKSPILAWISDDITDAELDELVEHYSKERSLFCPAEYLKLL